MDLELEHGLSRYGIGGRSGTTAATAGHYIGVLWNGHATKSIFVRSMTMSKLAGGAGQLMRRLTTRGTPATTETPDIDNDFERLKAPISGTVLDLGAYSVQPTQSLPEDLVRPMPSGAAAAPGPIWEVYFGETGIRVYAGTGLGVAQTGATASQYDLSFIWDE
jgi:hypothetical protein